MSHSNSCEDSSRHKLVVVTPAGRKHYLAILKSYILKDNDIDEWHLWDNCRKEEDRIYLDSLPAADPRIKIIRIPGVDGTNRSVNKFYSECANPNCFYIKVDDDIVYMDEGFTRSIYERACQERERYLWWSPLVINNAVCTWLLKYHSSISIQEDLSCQASDQTGWRDGEFARSLHEKFLAALEQGDLKGFRVPDFDVSLSRYSINAIGFFGSDVARLGNVFCPPHVDDEEWISAYLPTREQRPGRVIGDQIVSHFSFNTQEAILLKSGLLDRYFTLAGMAPVPYARPAISLKKRFLRAARAFTQSFGD